jgi:carbonic anhydrase
MTPVDMGILNPWLRNIRDVYRLHEKELDSFTDVHAKYNRLIELNVLEQCKNVLKTAVVQKHYAERGFPLIHGWVFDLHNGLLVDLDFHFEDNLKEIQKIYKLVD